MRYVLQYDGISASLHTAPKDVFHFKLSIDLANHSDEYMRYEVESVTITIGAATRTDGLQAGRALIIAPHAKSTFMCAALRTLGNLPLAGSLLLTARYGHPSVPPRYRVQWEFALHGFPAAGSRAPQVTTTLLREAEIEDIYPSPGARRLSTAHSAVPVFEGSEK